MVQGARVSEQKQRGSGQTSQPLVHKEKSPPVEAEQRGPTHDEDRFFIKRWLLAGYQLG